MLLKLFKKPLKQLLKYVVKDSINLTKFLPLVNLQISLYVCFFLKQLIITKYTSVIQISDRFTLRYLAVALKLVIKISYYY